MSAAKYLILILLFPILAGLAIHHQKLKPKVEEPPKVTENCIRMDIIEYGDSKDESIEKCLYIADQFSTTYTLIKIDSKYSAQSDGPLWISELTVDINKYNFGKITKPDKSF